MKRKNGALTLKGVGVFERATGGLNIDDVKNIRDALVKVYLPIIMADPELKAQYQTRTIRELQSVDARINRQNERAMQGIFEGGLHLFGSETGASRTGFIAALASAASAAVALLQQQPPAQ